MAAWTRAAVEALGPLTNVPTTAAILGVHPEMVYNAIRGGTWTTTRVLRLGRKIKIPTLDLIRLLFAPEEGSTATPPRVPSVCHHRANGQVNVHESQSECGCWVTSGAAVLPLRATS